ncbi:hemin import ATP-binding protein HmuV [bacterium BMS3Bbin04]|nr:hemin import ATP-binding protein HmuV [bacterium BMS3Bbin04]
MREGSLIEVSGLRVQYGNSVALENVSFQVHAGERIAVVGPNGAGKSTLFHTLAGLKKAQAGSVLMHSTSNNPLNIAFLPQRPTLDWTFPMSVLDAVQLGLSLKLSRHEAKRESLDALDLVSLGDLAKTRINRLSGGQQQRVLIARALAVKADALLMDEPLVGLDTPSRESVFNCLDTLTERNIPVMVALHDLNLAAARFSRTMLINKTLIADGKPTDIFTTENLTATYGSHLHVVRTEDGAVLVSDTCCGGGHG